MKKLIALVMTLSVLAGTVALADGSKDKKPAPKKTEKKAAPKQQAKLTDVWTCAMTGEAVTDKKVKGYAVGTYRVHFCCTGCDTEFFKLSKDAQLAKAKAAAEKGKG